MTENKRKLSKNLKKEKSEKEYLENSVQIMQGKNPDKKKLELYIHIPFCVKKCNYCDFLSSPADRGTQEAYMAALFLEVVRRAAEYRDYRIVSVFIGGGTPSVVEAKWIKQLMKLVKEHYRLTFDAEVTIEVNPGTVDEEKLKTYAGAGINRLSIGLQSADDGELERMGRIHNYVQFLETYKAARAAGFTNINVDVMSALPGQTLDSYRATLKRVLALNPIPEHISAYSLIVEEGTPFARWQEEGTLDVPDEDTERKMYEETKRILQAAGFQRYEISNYAREGFVCRHNCGYWQRVDYVGFGIGAASLIKDIRFCNDRDLKKYLVAPLEQRVQVQTLSVEEQMEEFMFLGLRMTRGVCAEHFQECFGRTLTEVYGTVIEQNIRDGLLRYYEAADSGLQDTADSVLRDTACGKKKTCLALTDRGLDLSNYCMAQFLFDRD